MSFASRWVEAPAHVTELPGGLPAGFRAGGAACGIKPSGAPDIGLLISDEPDTVSAARFTRSGTPAPPVLLCRERSRLDALRAVVVNSGNANAATGRRGYEDAARMQGGGAMAAGVHEDRVAVVLDRRHRRAAADDGDHPRDRARPRRALPRRRRVVLGGDRDHGRVREAGLARGGAAVGHRPRVRPGEGRRHAAAELRHHALLRADRRGARQAETAELLLGVCVKRSFDRISVDGQLSTNDTALLMASGASGVVVEPESQDELRLGEALDYAFRRLALQMVRDGEGAERVGRVHVQRRRRRRGRARRPRRRQLPAGEGGAARRRPELGPDRRRPSAARCRRRRRCPSTSGSRASRCARGGAAARHDAEALAGAVSGAGGRVPRRAAGRGRRDRGLLLRPLATTTSASTRTTRHERARRRDGRRVARRGRVRPAGVLLEALPYIREFHGRTVVIKYGGAAMTDPALREDFARDVVLLKYVGMNPIVVHGGGPEITHYMERLDLPVEFIGGLRVSDAETVEIAKMVLVGKVNKDIVLRLGRHGQPAVGLCGDDGMLFRVSTMEGPGGEDIGYVGRIERVDAGVIRHVAEDYIPVIASVGADREGRSHNVNADDAAGGGGARAGRLQGRLPHRRARVAARSRRPGLGHLGDRPPTR